MLVWLAPAFATPVDLGSSGGASGGTSPLPAGDLHQNAAPAPAVVNGDVVQGDDWADAVGIAFGNQVGCTGTLIAPDVVLTAGHCADGITHAVVGTNDTRQGDWIRARRVIEHPSSQSTYDVALVLLDREVRGITPRALAVDCVLDEWLRDGADVAVVGFGATNYAGTQYTNLKHEGYTQVQDADCSQNSIDGYASGCNGRVRPGGEIGAGGNNVDSCFGDSGGPLYLLGDDAEWLVGVTSRSYAGVPYSAPCRYGGIYTRPDAVLDWIEDEAGPVALPVCNHAPRVQERTLQAPEGRADAQLAFEDQDRAPDARWSIRTPPSHGEATLSRDGALQYRAAPGYLGEDRLVVEIDDGGNPDWPRTGTPLAGTGEIRIEVTADGGGTSGDEPAKDVDGDGIADLEVSEDDGAGDDTYRRLGCDAAAATPSALAIALALGGLARRRLRTA